MNIIDNAKSLVNLASEVNKIELYRQAVDLMGQVTEQQQQIMTLSEELNAMREQMKLREALVFDANCYWKMVPTDPAVRQGPYCSRCFDVLGKTIRMHDTHMNAGGEENVFQCPECKKPNKSLNAASRMRLGL